LPHAKALAQQYNIRHISYGSNKVSGALETGSDASQAFSIQF